MIKNSNKIYKVLGILIAIAGSSLPLAAMMPIILYNQTSQQVTCTITQLGSSTPKYTYNIPAGSYAPAFSLPVNANYIITTSSSHFGGSLTFSSYANQYATILVNNLPKSPISPMTIYYTQTT